MLKNLLIIQVLVFLFVLRIFPVSINSPSGKESIDSTDIVWVAKWQSDQKSAFSFSFDDSFISQFENITPILNQFGFKGTFYVLPLFLTEQLPGIWRYGTWPMFEAMSLEGHEIGSHSMTHPHLPELEIGDTLTEGTINYELYWSRQLIEQRITTQNCITFAYPFAERNEIVDSIASLYYESARSDTAKPNPTSMSGMQWFTLNAFEVIFDEPRNTLEDDLDELELLKNNIDSTIAKEQWGILLAHESVPYDSLAGLIAAGSWNPLSNEWLELLCQWVYSHKNNNNIWVAPVGDVTRYIKERDSYSYNILSYNENQVKLNLFDDLDDVIYNYPLSVFIKVPENWDFAVLIQGERIDTLDVFSNDSGKVVLASIIPDGGEAILSKMSSTGIEEQIFTSIEDYTLFQNFPNPFNPTTVIKYVLSREQFVTLKVYDILGNEVATLVNEEKPAGNYEVEFSAKDRSIFDRHASSLSSGVYIYTLRVGNKQTSRKMVIAK